MLQKLQEATRSHHVRKNDQLSKFLLSQNTKKEKPKSQAVAASKPRTSSKQITVLLVEDVDIVYEQDDAFLSALAQLLSTSKRPIILTTSDPSSLHIRKFVSQYRTIGFKPLSGSLIGPYLQILCLVEGLVLDGAGLRRLVEWNDGDVRKTILQLQYWVQGCRKAENNGRAEDGLGNGGEEEVCVSPSKSGEHKSEGSDGELDCEDENSNLSWTNSDSSDRVGAIVCSESLVTGGYFPSKHQVRILFYMFRFGCANLKIFSDHT